MPKLQVTSEVAGVVRELCAKPGDSLGADDQVAIVDCMKMELPVCTPSAGRLVEYLVGAGDPVAEGQAIATLES